MKNLLFLILPFLAFAHLSAQQSANNDEFGNPASLGQWSNITSPAGYNAEHFETIEISGDQLVLEPYTSAWFADRRGGFIYKELTGDFVFTTEVNASINAMPSTYSLGGLFLRSPQVGSETANNVHNYVFLATGYADPGHFSCPGPCPAPHLEVKNTVNSSSNLRVASVGVGPVTIRIARLDDDIICLYRPNGATDFIVHQRYVRNDFPSTIQAGFVSYTDWPKVQTYTPDFHNNNVLNSSLMPDPSDNPGLAFNPSITASFQYARFHDVTVPNGLNPATASDQELLDFLGFEPNAVLPVVWGDVAAKVISSDVLLEWNVHSLSDHDRFVVEYSQDGRAFHHLADVDDQHLLTDDIYKYVHAGAGVGEHYYRIRQVDLDGSNSLSRVVVAKIETNDFLLVPNPATDQVRIHTRFEYEHVQVFNAQGQLIFQNAVPVKAINVADLAAGLYQVVIITPAGQRLRQTLVK